MLRAEAFAVDFARTEPAMQQLASLSAQHIDVRVGVINIRPFHYQCESWSLYPRCGTLGSGVRMIHRKLKLNDMPKQHIVV